MPSLVHHMPPQLMSLEWKYILFAHADHFQATKQTREDIFSELTLLGLYFLINDQILLTILWA